MLDPSYSDYRFDAAFVRRKAQRFVRGCEVDCGLTLSEALECNPFMLASARRIWAKELRACWAFCPA